jgi:DNA-binding transcriptional ArsR family regulator
MQLMRDGRQTQSMPLEQRPEYTAGSPFVQLLEHEGRVRMLDVFLRKHSSDLSKSEIARLADIHPSTVGRNIDELVDMGIIKEIGDKRNKQYHLDKDNDLVMTLGKFHTELIAHSDSIDETEQQVQRRISRNALSFIKNNSDESDDSTLPRDMIDQAIIHA